MSLINTLRKQLAQEKELPFAAFMHMALYDPNQGYYSSGLSKFGKEGDFITAPELSPLFGKTLANQCQQIIATLPSPELFEFGAGTGALCVAILSHLETLNCLPEQYFILELSANLRHRQQQLIQEKIPHLQEKITWLDRWPTTPFNGVVIANEVLDAMPVHRFMQGTDHILESFITLNEQEELVEVFKPCQDKRLIDHIREHLPALPLGYISEANLFIDDWVQHNYQMLNQGAMILIDYGFPRHEYYHPQRTQGTLMCHYRHQAHHDFLAQPGEQDITAHVDFTHVAEAGLKAGFLVAGYTNQASFLLGNGILDLLQDLDSEVEQFRAKQAIKQLTHPSEMGELFKVLALTKNLNMGLSGFTFNDKRASL